ncbi:MAG: BNR repeat-containing protein [Saprospiraceae bacterium]|nr:BNR repeat-containing protein [Saprospiraceae bacterium]
MFKQVKDLYLFTALFLLGCTQQQVQTGIIIDESDDIDSIVQTIKIDSVWAGHPVGFCLYTHESRQYIAYYNANRNTVVGQRDLDQDQFELHILPATSRETAGGTSTVLGWDSHNFLTIGIDKEGFIHLSGNVHVHPLTYFRSQQPHDISTLKQVFEMVGTEEKRTTYPHFMLTKEKDLLYHYRDGGSGNGNEIYNAYSVDEKSWSRMLDVPLTDGQGLMNAYQTQPTIRKDGWYHVYWVWRDTPDCSTNHDLSYMKSPDLKNWYNAFGEAFELPATIDKKLLIVDPIPPKGGIINLAAKLVLDEQDQPIFVYHKYDADGNIQLYTAHIEENTWIYQQLTEWNYRWEFSGNGSINKEVHIRDFQRRDDGNYEIDYWHLKYGNGVILLNEELDSIGKVLKPQQFALNLQVEGDFPGLQVRTSHDLGKASTKETRYLLKWETINRNRDKPREKPWPSPSQLYLYKLQKETARN